MKDSVCERNSTDGNKNPNALDPAETAELIDGDERFVRREVIREQHRREWVKYNIAHTEGRPLAR